MNFKDYIKNEDFIAKIHTNMMIDPDTVDGIKEYYYNWECILKNPENYDEIKEENLNKSIRIICKPLNKCNQNCFYCFDKKFQDQKTLLDKKTILNFADKILSEYEQVKWTWHGGEITLLDIEWLDNMNFELIKISNKYHHNIEFAMQSNGTFSEDWWELIYKYRINIGISYDFINNKSRNYYLSNDKLNHVSSVIVVINKFNIDHLEKIYLDSMDKNYNVCFNFPRATNNLTVEDILGCSIEEGINKFKNFILNTYLYSPLVNPERTSNSLILLSLGKQTNLCSFTDCTQDNSLVLGADGYIRHCDDCSAKEIILLHVNDYINSSSVNKEEHFKELNNLKNTKCVNCTYCDICCGGCLINYIYSKSNNLHCKIIQSIIPDLYEKLNNLTPEEFIKLSPAVKELLIHDHYVPTSIKEKILCEQQ